jgi:hypothetical protein
MPDTGAPWNIPYIAPTDNPRVYPAADEAQALAIAAGLTDVSVIRQVVSTTKTDTFSASVAEGAISGVVTGLEVTITPETNTNKVIIIAMLTTSASVAGHQNYTTLFRGGSALTGATGDAAGTRQRVSTGQQPQSVDALYQQTIVFFDSPASTSALTYGVALSHGRSASNTLFVNRSSGDTDSNRFGRGISSITALEVAA